MPQAINPVRAPSNGGYARELYPVDMVSAGFWTVSSVGKAETGYVNNGQDGGVDTPNSQTDGIQEVINKAAAAAPANPSQTVKLLGPGTFNLEAPLVIPAGIDVVCEPGVVLNQPLGATWSVVTKAGGRNFSIFVVVVGTALAPNVSGSWMGGQFTTANAVADQSSSGFAIGGNVQDYTINGTQVTGLTRYDVWVTAYVSWNGVIYDGPVTNLQIVNMTSTNLGTTSGTNDGGGFKFQNNSSASNIVGVLHVGHTVSGAVFSCYDTNSNQGTNYGLINQGFNYTMANTGVSGNAPILLENPAGGATVTDNGIELGPGFATGGENCVSVGSAHSQVKVRDVVASGWSSSGAGFLINPVATGYAATSQDILFDGCSAVGSGGGANAQTGFQFLFNAAFAGSMLTNVKVTNMTITGVNIGINLAWSTTRTTGPVTFLGVDVSALAGVGPLPIKLACPFAGLTGGNLLIDSCPGINFGIFAIPWMNASAGVGVGASGGAALPTLLATAYTFTGANVFQLFIANSSGSGTVTIKDAAGNIWVNAASMTAAGATYIVFKDWTISFGTADPTTATVATL